MAIAPERVRPVTGVRRAVRLLAALPVIRHRRKKLLGRRTVILLLPLHAQSVPRVCIVALA